MGDENSEMMNLDLNLGPTSPLDIDPRSESLTRENVNLDDGIEGPPEVGVWQNLWPRMVERWHPLLAARERDNTINPVGDGLQTGEGSEINSDVAKGYKNDKNESEKEEEEKEKEKGSSGGNGNFFDCNICLELSSDPVLTCCGHLFCWPCLHQWLNVESDTKECPICKGEVTDKNLTPIYGRGSNINNQKRSLEIPDRPRAKRVESWRQMIQRDDPMEVMIRRLESTGSYRTYLTSRGMRQEEVTTTVTPDEVIEIDLTRSSSVRSEADAMRVDAYLRRSHTYLSAPTEELADITRRLIESYLRYTSLERSLAQPLAEDRDRDSVSSIAAVIRSESQAEIDSTVSRSTSSSRRRVDASRVSDVDSGDSRAPRRRRLD